MQFEFFLSYSKSHPGPCLYIIVYPINVRVGMMNNVMFHIPHDCTCTKEIQGEPGHLVYYFKSAEASMGSIMHHIETNRCGKTTKQDTFRNGNPYHRSKKYQVDINQNISNT